MEDIIAKLQHKDRNYKVTVKKKFIDDALYINSNERMASVYVVVINRHKNYDPVINQKMTQIQRQKPRQISVNPKSNVEKASSSSEDEAETKARMEHQKHEIAKNRHKMNGGLSRSAHPSSMIKSKVSAVAQPNDKQGYESDGGVR